jgi:hypothetical protein
VATKLRNPALFSSDQVVVPSGTGPDIFYDHGDGYITIYTQLDVEGADTIYQPTRREPKAAGVTYSTDVLDSDG